MAHVSHKLKNAFEGALAGGGDPATSPLYVFGPFLKLIVLAGVAQVTFGASVWLAIVTIIVVSAMYRLVMQWVTDGSGGSGLSEEEFGSWAVKVNAAITFIEYTLTFLVSMAAMVTFIADRLPVLNESFLGIQYRTFVAIALSILTGWLVNRGPRMAARTFGPATAGVLLLLWAMIIATIWQFGLNLPTINLLAFTPHYFELTLAGYVRILAVMTGIEVFANLVAAYDGTDAQKSKKAFNSLLIIMGTTAAVMLIVGPAIFALADPTNAHVSVFTQTMDILLPAPIALLGTLVGIAVLMSASAASAQGLQNLALGLKQRGYIPPVMGEQNKFEVADKPVWLEVGLVILAFLFFGTSEETYLAIYAAGVFVLLSMTGWAVAKRLIREARANPTFSKIALIIGAVLASVLTTTATGIIFFERFFEGAWTYLLFVPLLYVIFTYFRNRFGEPAPAQEYLGQLNASQLAGFGFGQSPQPDTINGNGSQQEVDLTWDPEPKDLSHWREEKVTIKNILLLLDGSTFAAQAIPMSKKISKATGATIHLLSSVKNHTPALKKEFESTAEERAAYLKSVEQELMKDEIPAVSYVRPGFVVDAAAAIVDELKIDLVISTTRGKSGRINWLNGGLSHKLVHRLDVPILLVQDKENLNTDALPTFDRILVTLDGSIFSERVLPYARAFAKAFNSEIILLSVPAVPDIQHYRAAGSLLEKLRAEAVRKMSGFLAAVARSLKEEGIKTRSFVTGSIPAATIIKVAKQQKTDLTMMTSQGRGGLDLLLTGSVAQQVVKDSPKSVFMVPVQEEIKTNK